MLQKLVKGVGEGGFRGDFGGKGGWWVKNFFLHPNELLIWAYPENLVEIRLLVEAVDELCGRGGQGRAGDGTR